MKKFGFSQKSSIQAKKAVLEEYEDDKDADEMARIHGNKDNSNIDESNSHSDMEDTSSEDADDADEAKDKEKEV